ncbi:MAG: class II aldolase/adducin family protein [Chloroflexi bacterium]|nr:class II aldolase/adducin family protein [Chloroflexota bacterium]
MNDLLHELWILTRTLGEPERDCVIIGEGNTSARIDADTFYIKASGQQMASIEPAGLVAVRIAPMLALVDADPAPSMDEQKARAKTAKLDLNAPDPSIEVTFHALLLAECGVKFIAHTHPTPVVSILCSPRAEEFANHRSFPDEAVLCGPRSAFVPYADPGLPLACAIRESVRAYMQTEGEAPRTILLKNHGLIALGQTAREALNITMMTIKAARVFAGAAALGGPLFLSDEDVQHIVRRPDEIYRRNQFARTNS